jgi:coproporphyrinogen III oxidase-like Fe-S oxidoreductase
VRLSNPRSITTFLERSASGWGATVEIIGAEDFLVENLMMGLRMADGVPSAQIESRFGSPLPRLLPGLWEHWVEKGWARPPSDRLALTGQGMLLLDHLIGEMIGAISDGAPWRGAEVVWP